jgi:hypothetical protein
MASSHVPSAAQYPRRGAGRKGAFGVASDGASATLAPVTTTSTAAKTRERGRSRVERAEVRALCVPYRRGTHGPLWLLTVSRNRCSTALCWPCHVIPKL